MTRAHKQTNKHTIDIYRGRLLPGEEIRVLVPDFPVVVGGQGGQEGGRGDALGLLGSVAVPDSRNSRGSPRHTGVLEGPATHSMRWVSLVDLRRKARFNRTTISGTAC